jgi:hypothetical protein
MSDENQIEKTYTAAGQIFIGFGTLVFLTMVMALPFMYFWNNTLIEVTTFCKEITFWQSMGMLLFIFFIGRIFNLNKIGK